MCQSVKVLRNDPSYVESVIWRVPIVDMECAYSADRLITRRATGHFFQAYRSLLEHCGPFYNQPRESQDVAFDYMQAIEIDALTFITKEGYIGMASSQDTRPDDVVCILGASVPFILREGSEGGYNLICDAHVHGIMDGETMEKSPNIKEFDVI
ncbi:hypothetical protein AOQ84DRAFT_369392 [Glonium stellatum]|uniref:Uncharacterized protein n=1 Tax=Glonium stellatum TaxID=574774 RepID=A0A8E2EP15_9PEZI|nr:hypothetical protein AOQ84DRAFT_369392 [Glonium stellatum]